jgi:Tol biopolymer transport system component
MDRQGRSLGSAGPATDYVSVQLSPDGSSVAYCARDQDLGTNDVYMLDLQRDAERRLTTDRRTENVPIWTPDAQTLVYAADRNGPPSLFAKPANGTGEERPIVPPGIGGPQRAASITPDGRFVLYVHNAPQTASDILIAPMDGSGGPTPVIQTKEREGGQRFLLAPDAPREAGAVSVVLHWPALLR